MSDKNPSIHKNPFEKINLQTWLFVAAILIYIATRFIGIIKFPIFFFTDEAIQSVAASDLVNNQFRDPNGVFLPTYFENGGQYNLGLSVYWQILPNLLFGQQIPVTRGAAVLATLLAAIFLSLILRDFFKVKHWWLGSLLLAAAPAWFLHSRTAFETTLMASMFTGFMYYYLSYRYLKTKHLYIALIFGALTFYAYSPGQVVIVATGTFLIFSDLKYHLQQRNVVLPALILLFLLTLPYIRFRTSMGNEIQHHLQQLNSYWLDPIPLHEKIWQYLLRYIKGLNPLYWYLPNEVDLIRHRMKGMGHLLLPGLPFLVAGLLLCLKNFKESKYRILIFSLLAAPAGAAIVDIAITRSLVLIIPATLLTALGIEWFLANMTRYKIPLRTTSILAFILIAGSSAWMLFESLVNGPTWYSNYGLYGLQYGGKTLFDEIEIVLEKEPQKKIVLSPSWANGTDVLARYFLGDPLPIYIGTIEEYAINYLPLDANTLFIMLSNEYAWMLETGKFTNTTVHKTLPCPNSTPCFYFVSLEYVPEIEQILAEEIAQRRILQEREIHLLGQTVQVHYSMLDINEIEQAFDDDDTTLIRTFEANPLKIVLSFQESVELKGLTALVGGTSTSIVIKLNPEMKETNLVFQKEVGESNMLQRIDFDFKEAVMVYSLEIEILNIYDPEIAHVHLWELSFK